MDALYRYQVRGGTVVVVGLLVRPLQIYGRLRQTAASVLVRNQSNRQLKMESVDFMGGLEAGLDKQGVER
jgi:hypothetical protein